MSDAVLNPAILLLALLGAALAGFINTLAGNGSAITLAILTEAVGLPPLVANGTNRLGTMGASATSFWKFWRSGTIDWRRGRSLLVPVFIGALVGGYLSTIVSNAEFRQIFRWTLLVLLVLVFIKPRRWIQERPDARPWHPALFVPLAFIVGIYGGFIQMGFGVMFLALAVLGGGYSLAKANAYKVAVVALYTPVLLVGYIKSGLISWPVGLLMAGGQAAAGYFTASFAIHSPRAGRVAYVVLIVVVLAAVLKIFVFN